MAARLLLIDDDVSFCGFVQVVLTKRGFDVEVAHSSITGLRKAYAHPPDVVLLDVMLPDMDGRDTCRRFREMSNVPIVMLTALGSQKDVVRGLELGADDYIVKPVTADVLVARLQAVLRRTSQPSFKVEGLAPVFTYDNLVINFENHEVTLDGERVELTPIEFSLLAVLVRNRGRVLTHEDLLRAVWGEEYIGETSYVRLYVRYLRCKLEKDPSKPRLICTEWGLGYRFG